MSKGGKFILVHWLEDDQVGVVPSSSVKRGQQIYSGAYAEVKWKKDFYECKVLKVSDNRQELMKECDRIVNMELDMNDIIEGVEREVDSTTDTDPDTPVKLPPKKKQKVHVTKMEAAQKRASEIFTYLGENTKDEVGDLKKQLMSLQKELAEAKKSGSLKNTAQSVKVTNSSFEAVQKNVYHRIDDDDSLSTSLVDTETEPYYEDDDIVTPKATLNDTTATPTGRPKPSNVTTGTRGGLKISCSRGGVSDNSQPTKTTPPIGKYCQASTSHGSDSMSKTSPALRKEAGAYKVQPQPVEMVPGYGVFLTQRQLDAALDGAKDSPTRLMRNLVGTFFTPEVLAVSSVYGTGKHAALDRDVIDTCIHFVQQRYEHCSKSVLVEAANDKCSNYRRKRQVKPQPK